LVYIRLHLIARNLREEREREGVGERERERGRAREREREREGERERGGGCGETGRPTCDHQPLISGHLWPQTSYPCQTLGVVVSSLDDDNI
jgi:hypothetical protein